MEGPFLEGLLLELTSQTIDLHLLFELLSLATLEDHISLLFLLQLTDTSLNLWEYTLLTNGSLEATGIVVQFLFIELSLREGATQGYILG